MTPALRLTLKHESSLTARWQRANGANDTATSFCTKLETLCKPPIGDCPSFH